VDPCHLPTRKDHFRDDCSKGEPDPVAEEDSTKHGDEETGCGIEDDVEGQTAEPCPKTTARLQVGNGGSEGGSYGLISNDRDIIVVGFGRVVFVVRRRRGVEGVNWNIGGGLGAFDHAQSRNHITVGIADLDTLVIEVEKAAFFAYSKK